MLLFNVVLILYYKDNAFIWEMQIKFELSPNKFLDSCFQSISDSIVEHISESRSYTYDESDRDCTSNDCPNYSDDSINDDWNCFHNVVVLVVILIC